MPRKPKTGLQAGPLGKRYTLGNFKPLLLSQIRAAGNRAHDKAKMVSVIPATLREGPFVREIGLSGEHAHRFAGPAYAIALEIANVR